MSDLVAQEVGMFAGVGEIYTDHLTQHAASHYFAYDAGRKVIEF
jgi:hypothetical protein